MALIDLLDWDTNFFGFRVARLRADSAGQLEEALAICVERQVRLLICRLSTDNVRFAQQLERHGFQLMDTVTRYRLQLATVPPAPALKGIAIRPCLASEADALADIARAVYVNHMGHFHNDPRLDRDKCNGVYAEMARNSCLDRSLADIVLVAEADGHILGFHSHKVVQPNGLAGVISGVSRESQGKGIGKALITASADWGKAHDLDWIEEYPHINHPSMHKMMADLGFRLQASSYTFHKWFGEAN